MILGKKSSIDMQKNTSFKQSLINALSGLKLLIEQERNSRFHLIATILVIFVSTLLRLNSIEWLFIILAIFLVWITEAVNTSLEKLFNLVEPTTNAMVKVGKDMAAGAVLLSAILSILIGLFVLGPPILTKISQLFLASSYK